MPANRDSPRRSGTWINANAGNVYYRPRASSSRKNPPTARFPRPLIEPRRTRPQAIHIVTYPPGYVPPELRPAAGTSRVRRIKVQAAKAKRRLGDARAPSSDVAQEAPEGAADRSTIRPVLEKILNTFSSVAFHNPDRRNSAPAIPVAAAAATDRASATRLSSISSDGGDVIHQVASAPSRQSLAPHSHSRTATTCSTTTAGCGSTSTAATSTTAAAATASTASTTTTSTTTTSATATAATPTAAAAAAASTLPTSTSTSTSALPPPSTSAHCAPATSTTARAASDSDVAGPPPAPHTGHRRLSPPAGTASLAPSRSRSSMMAVRSAKPTFASFGVAEVPKPVASGSGVSCSILLAEPTVFLSGFDHDGHARREGRTGTALLRGKLQLSVTKNVKIKAVQLKLVGRARTEWPEGIPPLKQDIFEEQSLRTQVLTFFNAMNDGWETEYGNQCSYRLKNPTSAASKSPSTYLVLDPSPPAAAGRTLTARDLKRLSLQSAQSRSFGKGDNPSTPSTQAKGFKIFYPGRYEYSFELPIDHHQLETTKLQYGSVRWDLHASVDRAGAFKPNLHGTKEVPIVRIPDQMSLEMTEPISISRQWEDQLHYDIIVSGKSFPIGGKIPIAFKLTPLAKVQVHKLKVFATETVEYWTNDRRVTRKDPGRKILLLEKNAGKPLDDAWSSSDLRTVRGGELSAQQRREARDLASARRTAESARRNSRPEPLPAPSDNLLGDLDLGLESYWGSTEIEANVQIPTCEMMAKSREKRLHPDCSWKNVNVYHWLKIVMRISRLDPDDPAGTKRRHFEISIDSPFTVLNCRATQANTILPAYTGNQSQTQLHQSSCGCPDATVVPAELSPSSSTGTLSAVERGDEPLPALPQAAHLANSAPNRPSETAETPASDQQRANEPRPIHLLRVPSFNPPAFEEDVAPPPALAEDVSLLDGGQVPLATPPPQYDSVIGTPSVDGLADYFSRLADYGYDNDGSDSDSDESPPRILERSGRVNVAHPRTPGGRMPSRSMEISRPPINLTLDRRPNPTQAAG